MSNYKIDYSDISWFFGFLVFISRSWRIYKEKSVMNKTACLLIFLFGVIVVGCFNVQTVVDEQSDGEQMLKSSTSTVSNAEGEEDVLYFVVFIDPAYKTVQVMKLPFLLALKKKELHDKFLSYEVKQLEQDNSVSTFNDSQHKTEVLEGLRQEMLAIRGRVISLNSKQVPTDIKEGALLDKVNPEGEASESECKYVVFK